LFLTLEDVSGGQLIGVRPGFSIAMPPPGT
jgi:hypothetical protein